MLLTQFKQLWYQSLFNNYWIRLSKMASLFYHNPIHSIRDDVVQPGRCCVSSLLRWPYLVVFASSFLDRLSVHGQLISTADTFLLSMNLSFSLSSVPSGCDQHRQGHTRQKTWAWHDSGPVHTFPDIFENGRFFFRPSV